MKIYKYNDKIYEYTHFQEIKSASVEHTFSNTQKLLIIKKHKKLRKINQSLHIFTNHHKICNDIQNLILSFLI